MVRYLSLLSIFLFSPSLYGVPSSDGAHEENVTFYAQKEKGSKEYNARKGYLAIKPGAKATILVMHGYTSNKEDANALRLLFPDYNVMVFDFRAHGEDTEGQYSTLGADEVHDIFAAVDYLKNREDLKDVPIIAYGFSMGAATGIEAQSQRPDMFLASVFDCPFDKTENILKRGLDKLKIKVFGYEFDIPGRGFLEQHAFSPYVQPVLQFMFKRFAKMDATQINTFMKPISPMESVKKIEVPVFLIGCAADKTVPVASVRQIYENAPGTKRLWVTKGVRHYGSMFDNPETYKRLITDFINQVLSGEIKGKEGSLEIIEAQDPDEVKPDKEEETKEVQPATT